MLQASAEIQRQMVSQRKALANEVLDVKGNIRVFCRVRPFLQREKDLGERSLCQHMTDESVTIYNPQTKKDKTYNYDAILGPTSSQEDAFVETKPVVEQVLEGFNVSVFAYGQTGSGKTWTMIGNPENRGINYRAMETLLARAAERSETIEDTFQMSMFEIYNEQMFDLLTPKGDSAKLEIRAASTGMVISGLTAETVTHMEGMAKVEDRGFNNRSTGKTNMNEHSSRSHCLTLINVTSRNRITGVTTWGKLYLIDLAGSERVNRSGVTDEALKEAQHINKSLSALTTCIVALHKKDGHVPFRDSKLTHVLQDSLGGNAKTMMFVNISPSGRAEDANETESSLRFAARVRKIELGQAKKQVDNSDMVKYKKMYEDAVSEIEDKTSEVLALKDQLKAAQEEQQILQETLGQSDGELTMLKMELDEKTQERDELEKSGEKHHRELLEKTKALEEKEEEYNNILDAYGEAEEEAQKQNQKAQEEITMLTKKLEILGSEQAGAANESAQIMAQREADLAAAQMHAQQQENEASTLREKLKETQQQLKDEKAGAKGASGDMSAMQESYDAMADEKAELMAAKLSLEDEKTMLHDELNQARAQIANLMARVKAGGGPAPAGDASSPPETNASSSPPPVPISKTADGGGDEMANLVDGFSNQSISMLDAELPEGERMHGNKMLQLLEKYTSCAEEQIDAQQKLISMLNDDEEEDEEAEAERDEMMAQLETDMYDKEDEKVQARNLAMQYAQQINVMLKQADEEKANLQRQYKFQFSRTKVAFDVVKDKLMKNIGDRAAALKAVRQELEAKETQLRRVSRQKQDAERGLLEMRCIFEDMKRIEHMKRGIELLKYPMGGGKPALKFLSLSNDETELQWRDTKKSTKFSSLTIREVEDVLIGWETPVFQRTSSADLPKPWFCLSVSCKNRTLDLSVSAEEDVITWVRGLLALVCIRPGRQAPPVDQLRGRINFLKANHSPTKQR